jgi:hypothetical protein
LDIKIVKNTKMLKYLYQKCWLSIYNII